MKVLQTLGQILRFTALAAVVVAISALLRIGAEYRLAEESFEKSFHAMRLTPPPGKPSLAQESIDLALMIYGIEVPKDVNHPVYDPEIDERGRTIFDFGKSKTSVTIGSAAFNSWSVLGSTLAHEIEIHTQQSILVINIMDMFGLNGTVAAERLAYAYEIVNASRFGLSKQDIAFMEETVHVFYPLNKQNSVFDRNFAAKALDFIDE